MYIYICITSIHTHECIYGIFLERQVKKFEAHEDEQKKPTSWSNGAWKSKWGDAGDSSNNDAAASQLGRQEIEDRLVDAATPESNPYDGPYWGWSVTNDSEEAVPQSDV